MRELLFLAELQEEDALEGVYVREDGVAQMILYVRDGGSPLLIPFLRRLEERLEAVPPPSGTAAVTGTVKLNQVFWDQMIARLLPGVLLSVVLVWVSLAWMFRSVRLGLLALLPNLFPLALLLGVMRLGGFDLKPSTAIVFSIAFGLAVDDTLHFLSKLRDHLAAKQSVRNAVEHTLRETGPPILMTSLAMAAGFSLLLMSQFQVLVLVGTMTAVSVVAAVFADLFALPSLIEVAFRRNGIGPSRT
ncbi:MAG: MMPL family transporter [Gemmatimonadetes bacterium]|nr:MMPL family transporter [Gemmatimonadota bacterium]